MNDEQFDKAINDLIGDAKKFMASGQAAIVEVRQETCSCSRGFVSVLWPSTGISTEDAGDVANWLYDVGRKIRTISERAEAKAKAAPPKPDDPPLASVEDREAAGDIPFHRQVVPPEDKPCDF